MLLEARLAPQGGAAIYTPKTPSVAHPAAMDGTIFVLYKSLLSLTPC